MRAAELLVRDGIARYEAGENAGAEANMAKMLAAEASWAAGEACIQTPGGFGVAAEYDIERKFRETRLYPVAPISPTMILSYVAEQKSDHSRVGTECVSTCRTGWASVH